MQFHSLAHSQLLSRRHNKIKKIKKIKNLKKSWLIKKLDSLSLSLGLNFVGILPCAAARDSGPARVRMVWWRLGA